MCGIVGAVTKSGARVEVGSALTALAHRGPDGGGEFHRQGVTLGHRRLSIIDLSAAASQPMSIDGCGTIVFNGEIYDHEVHRAALEARGELFTTRSDTEVLLRGLAKDGLAFLRALHGMYAFAWLDAQGRRLWLVRDHAGIKPLYVWRGPHGLAFASEVRALAKVIRSMGGTVRANPAALVGFLAWGSVPEPMTVLERAETVPADHAFEIDVQAVDVVGTVDVGRRPIHRNVSDEAPEALELTTSMMHDAVKRHLVADHPVALFLSSGIDSSVLGIEMASAGHPRAISVILHSRGTTDEPGLVVSFARRHNIPLEQVPVSNWRGRLLDALDAYDQPSIDGLNTFLVAGVAKDLGYRVALSGVGADEVFGGYDHMHGWRSRLLGDLAFGTLGRTVGGALGRISDPRARRIGLLLQGGASGLPAQRSWRRVFSDREIRTLLPGIPVPLDHIGRADPLELEQSTYLQDTLLRDTDVMGMAHGVEIRAPYLDPGVLEVAARIGTPTLLRRDKPPKWVLREGWARELESASLARKKTGFTLDVAGWLRGEGRQPLNDAKSVLERSAMVDRAGLDRSWPSWFAKLDSTHPAAWTPLFAMVQLATQLARWGDP